MSFLALASQKSLLTLQKSFLQLQFIGIQNDIQYAQAQMSAIQTEYNKNKDSSGSSSDYTEDSNYIYFEQLDEQLSTEKDSLDSQLTAIENEIASLKTMVNNNIKTSCTLNLATGS